MKTWETNTSIRHATDDAIPDPDGRFINNIHNPRRMAICYTTAKEWCVFLYGTYISAVMTEADAVLFVETGALP